MYELPPLGQFHALPVSLAEVEHVKEVMKNKDYYMYITARKGTIKPHVRIIARSAWAIQRPREKEVYTRILYYAKL